MVALIRFTKNLCRLLGIGSEVLGEQLPEQMDCGRVVPDRWTKQGTATQDGLACNGGLGEEVKARRRAERRRAKRKRQRERKKLVQVEKREGTESGGEDGNSGAESEWEESGSEGEEEVVLSGDRGMPDPQTLASVDWASRQPPAMRSEEEPEWDVRSAFVANAASHLKPKAGRGSRETKEIETRTKQVNAQDAATKQSTLLTKKGIKLVEQGQYSQAVGMFTEAIRYDPKDYRFFVNRSYCYECLGQYPSALSDAELSLQLAPQRPKGYFRKGRALMGMERYSEAELAMEQVLELDKDCQEAVDDLFQCRVLQLVVMGFDEPQSVNLLKRFTTVQAVLASPEVGRVLDPDAMHGLSRVPCRSLWVGNVTVDLTEKLLGDLFRKFGEIDSIRVLHERYCAFVNYKNADMAALAMERLQGLEIHNTRLVIRYPDRRAQRAVPSALQQAVAATCPRGVRRGVISRDEGWRTTGCDFGDKCRYKHVPEQRRPWPPQ